MILPCGSDVRVYHWPYTTVSLIAINVVLFLATLVHPGLTDSMALHYGHGLHPLEWITSNFLHGGIMHLVGDMLFLWAFGLIIEGKLGWYKTLAIYLGIGILSCAIEQGLCHHHAGRSFGASRIVMGLMAMSLIWAPESRIEYVVYYWYRPDIREIRVITLVVLYMALAIIAVSTSSLPFGSSLLHLSGAAIGLTIASVMLAKSWVDCEYRDIFSVWAGKHQMTREEREKEDANRPERRQQVEQAGRGAREMATQEIRQVMKLQPLLALKAHERMSQRHPDWSLSEGDHLQLIQALHQKNLLCESVPLMGEYLAKHLERRILVRLKLAQILVVQEKRPAQALAVLAKLNPDGLDKRCREFYDKLKAQAEQLRKTNTYDWVEHDW